MDSSVLEFTKLLGPVVTALFGHYGLGRESRDMNGGLTRHGKVARIGIVLSAVVTVVAVLAEGRQRTIDSAISKERFEDQLRSSLYQALSTRDGHFDVRFGIPIEGIRNVEPAYASRIQAAFAKADKCRSFKPAVDAPWIPRRFYCNGYIVDLFPSGRKDMRFESDSPLRPNAKREPNAWELFAGLGIDVTAIDETDNRIGGVFLNSALDEHDRRRWYSFDGTTLVMALRQAPMSKMRVNLHSIVDLLGRKMSIQLTNPACMTVMSGVSSVTRCQALHDTWLHAVELHYFALTFPHARDIVLDPKMELEQEPLPFKSEVDKSGRRVFTYTFPSSVTKIPVHNWSPLGAWAESS